VLVSNTGTLCWVRRRLRVRRRAMLGCTASSATSLCPAVVLKPWVLSACRAVADEGVDVMHNGNLAASLAAEIQAAGGVVTEADLASVQPQVRLGICRSITANSDHSTTSLVTGFISARLCQVSASSCSVCSVTR